MATYNVNTHIITVTLASTSVIVVLLAPGFRGGGWIMRSRTGSTAPALVWAYQGATPVSIPPQTSGVDGAGVYELAAGNTLNDQLTSVFPGADVGIGDGWAAVLESAGAATIDIIWR